MNLPKGVELVVPVKRNEANRQCRNTGPFGVSQSESIRTMCTYLLKKDIP